MKIGQCVDIVPGYAFKPYARHDPNGSHQVVLGRHMPVLGMRYDYQPAHELRVMPRGKMEKCRVMTGDVLFVSRGIRNQALLVNRVPEKTIASATFYLLRAREGVDGAYFAWFLNQSSMQNRIGRARTGAGTPIVQRKALADIVIPLPSLEEQRKIAKLGAYMLREQRLRWALADHNARLHALIGVHLIRDRFGSWN